MRLYRNVFSVVPHGKMKEIAAMLKSIQIQEDLAEATKKTESVADPARQNVQNSHLN